MAGNVLVLSRINHLAYRGIMNRLSLLVLFLALALALAPTRAAAQPDHEDPKFGGELVGAVEKGNRAQVIALLNRGAKINAQWLNQTPLSTAIWQQDVEMVKLLLSR